MATGNVIECLMYSCFYELQYQAHECGQSQNSLFFHFIIFYIFKKPSEIHKCLFLFTHKIMKESYRWLEGGGDSSVKK